jgi:hypothetical protein
VDNADLAGNGLAVAATGCALDVVVGCGLQIASGAVQVKASDLAGNGLVTSGTCGLAVGAGCGISVSADAISVSAATLAGAGLVVSGTCGLAVNPGCGLEIAADAVKVKPADLAGNGLAVSAGCTLEVGQGCGITVNANDIAVNAGIGLICHGGQVKVNTIPASAVVINSLDPGSCSLDLDEVNGKLKLTLAYTPVTITMNSDGIPIFAAAGTPTSIVLQEDAGAC